MAQNNDWTKHSVYYDHEDGRSTLMYMQTDGRSYVLSEHPDNKGPHVSEVASKYGDEAVRNNLDVDKKSLPENVQLYAERKDGRFDQWEAKTTMREDVSEKPNEYDSRPSEWQWRNGTQYEHKELEQKLGAELEQGHTRFQDKPQNQQDQEFREASMSNTWQSDQLREAAQATQQQEAPQPQPAQQDQTQQQQRSR